MADGFVADVAVVIGIATYDPALGVLETPVRDAETFAQLLASRFGYEVILQCDGTATLAGLRTLLHEELPRRVQEGSRLLLYFAGHGVALPNAELEGPQGYLVPHGATSEVESHLPMNELHEALKGLSCRHLLVILDCCFSGAFRWANQRPVYVPEELLYEECYQKWVRHPARWALASAAYDEHSLDSPDRRRGQKDDLSPFASAMRDGLSGKADLGPGGGDGIVTLVELYNYVLQRLAPHQTPLMTPLPGLTKGPFVFRDLHRARPLLSAEQTVILNEEENPYRGLESYGAEQTGFFFGRGQATRLLLRHVRRHLLTVVVGPSGCGKSSLVQAGLLPRLSIRHRQRKGRTVGWVVPPPLRVANDPFAALGETLAAAGGPPPPSPEELRDNPDAVKAWVASWQKSHPCERLLVVVDQAEELITRVPLDLAARPGDLPVPSARFLACLEILLAASAGRLRALIAVRSDYEPDLDGGPLAPLWNAGRFVVPLLSREELRQVVEGPAGRKALYFDDPALVDRLVDEVVGMPGGLPLLSYALSRLYLAYLRNGRGDRLLLAADLRTIGGDTIAATDGAIAPGGIMRILREAGDKAVQELPGAEETLWRVLLRMVNLVGTRKTRRQVPLRELEYSSEDENRRVTRVLEQLVNKARLLVSDRSGDSDLVEPAHDELLVSWPELARRIDKAQPLIPIHRRLTEAAAAWDAVSAPGERRRRRDLDLRLLGLLEKNLLPVEWLNRLETEYVAAARKERRQRARIQWSAIAALLILTVSAAFFLYRSIQDRKRAVLERAESLSHSAETANRQQDFAAGGLLAIESLSLGRTDAALTSLATSKSWSWPLVSLLQGHMGPLSGISYSPDGRWLASTAYFGDNNTVRLWDAKSFKPGPTLSHTDRVFRAVFHPNSQQVAVTDYADKVWIWNFGADEARVACSLQHSEVRSSTFEAQGNFIVTYSSKEAKIWDLTDCKDGKSLGDPFAKIDNDDLTTLEPIHQPLTFVTASHDAILLWRIEREKPIVRQRLEHPGGVNGVDVSSDGKRAITSGADGIARVWDLSGAKAALKQELRHDGRINSGKFSRDGRLVVTASADGTAKLWEDSGGTFKMKALLEHGAEVKSAFFDPASRWAVSWSYPPQDAGGSGSQESDILWVWEIGEGPGRPLAGRRVAALQAGSASAADFSPAGDMLAVAGFDNTGRVWKVGPARVEIPRDGFIGSSPYDAEKTTIGVDNEGQLILIDRYNEQIRVWNLPEAQERFPPLKIADQILPSLYLSNDGTRIAANDGRSVAQWNAKTGAPINSSPDVATHFSRFPRSALHNGSSIVINSDWGREEELQAWDLRSGDTSKLESQIEMIEQILASENEAYAALVGTEKNGPRGREGQRTELWDIRKGKLLGRFPQGLRLEAVHPKGLSIVGLEGGSSNQFTVLVAGENEPRVLEQDGWIMSAHFSPDGSKLVTASRNGTAWVWETQHWEHLGTLSHGAWVTYAAYDPRGEVLATTATDGSTKVWSASTYELLATLQHHQPQRICFFSPDASVLVSQSADKATVWHWRDEVVDPEEARLTLRFSMARQLQGIISERESWLRLPTGLPDPGSIASVREAARKLLSKPPNRSTIGAAAEAVLGDSDPALAWIDLYSALADHPRSNGYRLLVLEELERRETVSTEGKILGLLLDATRAEGSESFYPEGAERTAERLRADIRRRATEMIERGYRHRVLEVLAHLERPAPKS